MPLSLSRLTATLCFLSCLAVVRTSSAQTAPPAPSLPNLLQALASPDFNQRQAAQNDLAKIPPDQYDALQALAAQQSDEEVKARLQDRAADMLRQLLGRAADAPLRPHAHITGRVIDPAGKPVPGARVQAQSTNWGLDLARCVLPETLTAADGTYDLGLPFTEIAYSLSASDSDHPKSSLAKRIGVMPDKPVTAIGDLVLTPPRSIPVKGKLIDHAGAPVANQRVDIVGENEASGTGLTDDQGDFSIAVRGDYMGQALAIVHRGNQTLPVKILGRGAPVYQLVTAGTLVGKVQSTTGRPLAGVTIFARPNFMSGLFLNATTAADGTYTITDVPPGEYLIVGEAPGMTSLSPHKPEHALPTVAVGAGLTTTANIALEPMAILRGQVLDAAGQPVPDAVVGIISNWRGDYRDEWRSVQADAQGRFTTATGHTSTNNRPENVTLVAYSAQDGYAALPLPDLVSGELRNVSLKLSGSMRVAGTIRDAAGKPIPNIQAFSNAYPAANSLSDDAGRFDLGRVCLPLEKTPLQILLSAPRPAINDGATRGFPPRDAPPFNDRKSAPVFYAHQSVTIQDAAAARSLNLTMAAVQLLEFTGTVLDAAGNPVPGAEVYLFTGNAKPETWVESVHPTRDSGSIRMNSERLLTSGKTNADGRYSLWSVREDPTYPPIVNSGIDFTHFAVGAYSNGRNKLAEKLEVPKEGTLETKITLGAPFLGGQSLP